MKYIISKEAENDLENIWFYTFQNWSLNQADKYLSEIINQIKSISHNPDIGKDYSEIRDGYFCSKIKSHFIFYKVDKRKGIVKIIRILHERMDVKARINE